MSLAAPLGKPLMSVVLNPKPMLPVAADAGTASKNMAAAITAGTSAMAFIFIFQPFPSCHRESVAHTTGDAAPAAPAKSTAEQQARASLQTDRRMPNACGPSSGWDSGPIGRSGVSTLRRGSAPGIGQCPNCRVGGTPYFLRATLLARATGLVADELVDDPSRDAGVLQPGREGMANVVGAVQIDRLQQEMPGAGGQTRPTPSRDRLLPGSRVLGWPPRLGEGRIDGLVISHPRNAEVLCHGCLRDRRNRYH